ncbi:MAG: methylmalonic aciduria and homocystinuria type D protein [Cyanobacteria bacterium J06623_7]
MRSQLNISSINSMGRQIDVCVAPPHQFVLDHQAELLSWNAPIHYLIIVLQRSTLPLHQSGAAISAEKDRLRHEFINFGSQLIALIEQLGYLSDLFDPRTGYPLQAKPKLPLDDNATVAALLSYPLVRYQQCSLIIHPLWHQNVYPSTMATSAPLKVIETCLRQILSSR